MSPLREQGETAPGGLRWSWALAKRFLDGTLGSVVLGDLEEEIHDRLADGESAATTRRWARRQLLSSLFAVGIARVRDRSAGSSQTNANNKSRGDRPMGILLATTLQSLRSLMRQPAFSLLVIATLAVGIGMTATVFSVVEATLMRDLPVSDPDRLVMIWNRQQAKVDAASLFSPADYQDLADRSTTLSRVMAIGEVVVAPVVGTERPTFAREVPATSNLFAGLGVTPHIGRLFEEADGTPLADDIDPMQVPPDTAVISYDFWQRAFDGDPDILGATVRTFRNPKRIVGVLPPDFRLVLPAEAEVGEDLGSAIDLWTVMRWDFRQAGREGRWFRVMGRLANDSDLADARGELDNLAATLRREHDLHEQNGLELGAQPFVLESSRHIRPLLALLLGAVTAVLLVACVNVSSLLLTRMAGRERELVVRAALGASRLRLAAIAFSEAMLLAVAGAAGGLLLALIGMKTLQLLRPAGLPQAADLALNGPVLLFALLVAPLTALLASTAPALRAMRFRRGGALKTRETTASRTERRGQEALVAVQIALTVLLLVGTGLMLRTFLRLTEQPLGFDPDGVLMVDISTVGEVSPDRSREQVAAWVERRRLQEHDLQQRLEAIPGVAAASAVFPVPLNGVYSRTCSWELPSRTGDAGADAETLGGVAYFRNVWPGYFDTVSMPLLAGRDFELRDDPEGLPTWRQPDEEATDSPTVIIDQRLAERLWPGRDAVGQRLRYSISPSLTHDAEVIGVVPFVRQGGLRDELETVYIPRAYYRSQELALLIDAVGTDPMALRGSVADTVHQVFADSPLEFGLLDSVVHRASAQERFLLVLLGVFAAVALLLASVGLFGTLSLAVRRRITEIGIRLAMGAAPRTIGAGVLGRAVLVTLSGAALGLLAALALSRLLESQLFEISGRDPITFAGAALLQVAVGAVACWLPARRAARVDPALALNQD